MLTQNHLNLLAKLSCQTWLEECNKIATDFEICKKTGKLSYKLLNSDKFEESPINVLDTETYL